MHLKHLHHSCTHLLIHTSKKNLNRLVNNLCSQWKLHANLGLRKKGTNSDAKFSFRNLEQGKNPVFGIILELWNKGNKQLMA